MNKQSCIYCGSKATTRDHVPPRLLLERPFPKNLHTVPSCLDCNRGASKDEEYFLALIAQVSQSPNITAKLEPGGTLDRAFTRSPALEQRFLDAIGIDENTGQPFIHPELPRVARIVKKIALGLFELKYKWSPPLEAAHFANLFPSETQDARPLPYFLATFTERFNPKRWNTVQSGVFSYIFVRDPTHSSTVWCMMDFHGSFWGIVHLPRMHTGRIRSKNQLPLFKMEES